MTDIVKLDNGVGGVGGSYIGTNGCNGGFSHLAFADSLAAGRDIQNAHWIGEQGRDVLNAINTNSRHTDENVVRYGTDNLVKTLETSSEIKVEMLKGFCDVKELVRAESQKVCELVTSINSTNRDIQLQDLKQRLLAIEFSGGGA